MPPLHWRKNLKLLREQKDKTQAELGLQLKVSQQTIGNWEGGKSSPDLEQLVTITKFFGVTADDFLTKDLGNVHLTQNQENPKNVHQNVHQNVHPSDKIRTGSPHFNEAEPAHSFGAQDFLKPGKKKELIDALYAGLLAFTAEIELQKRVISLEDEVKELKRQVEKG